MHAGAMMGHHHEASLVVLSIVVALVGSYVALDFTEQAAMAEEETSRVRWLLCGGIVLGVTVWAMHFTGMLAFETDVPITWDFPVVFVAMMVAVAGSTAGLIVVGRRGRARWASLGGSVFVGFAIVGMHFTGMAAMRLEALPVYDARWVLLSAAVAMLGSGAGFLLALRERPEGAAPSVLAEVALKAGSAALVAFAIVGMHYAAMEALGLIPTEGAQNPAEQPVSPALSNYLLGWGVGVAALLILLLTLPGSAYGRRLKARAAGREAWEAGERRFRSLVQNSSEVVKVTDLDGTLRYASPAFGRVFGHDPEKAVGTNVFDYVHPDDAPKVRAEAEKASREPGTSNMAEYRFRHADGSWRHVESVGTYLLDDPAVRGVVVNVRDVTERKEFEGRLAHQAFHDPLTGLPNRALLLDRIKQGLARTRRGQGSIAALFLDLDDFKVVNDSLGHEAGDQLLVSVAEHLRETVRPEDTVARLGGDEFCILLENQAPREAAEAARRISESLSAAPFALGGDGGRAEDEVFVRVSMGIAISQPSHHRPADLLREADLAMYRAKGRGKGRQEVFEAGLARKVEERLRLEAELRRALLDPGAEFELHYQPKVCLKTSRIHWMEGLLRWRHPERGLLPPAEFVPVAEESGLILPLGRWVIREAMEQGHRWRREGGEMPAVCVNLSARQLEQEGLADEVERLLWETETDPETFGLEVTESVLVEDERSYANLRRLRDMGITLSIDDFGTGYASLSYLKRFPANVLKIDCSFIRGIEENHHDAVMVSGMIALAHATGKQTVAECVENTGQLFLLQEMGCEMGQGHLFSEPLPPDAAAAATSAS